MFDEMLWKGILILQKSKNGQRIVPLLLDSLLVKAYNDIRYKMDEKNPTDEMIEAREYYGKNQKRIRNMLSNMSDKESVDVLCKIIKYRQTHNRHDRPFYNRRCQYFPEDIVKLTENEVFVDCGAYNGDTIRSFFDYSNHQYNKIIAFEPDHDNAQRINEMKERIIVIEAAVWADDTQIAFEDGLGSSSRINVVGSNQVRAVKIDSIPECHEATFIEMDIEGAEYNALRGGEETIRRQLPILAICIYHSNEDIIRIFELINSWNLNYRFFVRHHAQKVSETVLYAIPETRCLKN